MPKRWTSFLCCGLFCYVIAPHPVRAEVYLAGQFGQASLGSLSDLQGVSSSAGSNAGATLSNVALQSGSIYGGKIGYYSSQLPWLGVEFEGYQISSRVKSQGFVVTRAGSTTTGSLAESAFKMTTWAVNALIRYPGQRFQPYVGVGVGLFNSNTDSTTQPGFNALAGLRIMLVKHIAVFGEWKYNYATTDFKDPTNSSLLFNGTYTANIFVGGLSFHF